MHDRERDGVRVRWGEGGTETLLSIMSSHLALCVCLAFRLPRERKCLHFYFFFYFRAGNENIDNFVS